MSAPAENVVLRINIPNLKLQKAIRVNPSDPVWTLRKQLEDKVASEIKDVLNYGLYLHGKDGKKGKFLDERIIVGDYHIDNTRQIDFILKCRIGGEAVNAKVQKKLLEDIEKGNLEKIKEKTGKNTEFNFLLEGETPIAAAVLNNDPDMITWLMDNGAFLDFRVGDKDGWKTPLHLAAIHNKSMALKTLLQYGAWPDTKDILGLSPLYYAASGGNTECVLRLLLAKAETETADENGRTALHMAVMNDYDCIVALLLDFQSDKHFQNVGGNTALHIAAARNSKESAKWLLLRGTDPSIKNKSNKTAQEVAHTASSAEVEAVIKKFTPDQIIPPPPSKITVEITERDAVVQHVLGSLGSNIGKQYTPQQYYSKKSIEAAKSTTSPSETTPKNNRGSLILENGVGSLKGRSSVRRSMILPSAPDAAAALKVGKTGLRGEITQTDSSESINVAGA